MRFTEFDIGWLCGLIDADGCLILRPRGKTFRSALSIGNVSKELMDELQEIIPEGKVYETKKQKPHHKQMYQFQLNRMKPLLHLLNEIAYGLIIKKKKAYIMIEMLKLRILRKTVKKPRTKKGAFSPVKVDPKEVQLYKRFNNLS